jgi:phage gp36-like protein
MDSYLLGRYVTPIAGPATILTALKEHCINLTLYVLFQDQLMAESYSTIQANRDTTMEWLKGIRDGKGSLPGAAPVALPTTADSSPNTALGGSEDPVYIGNFGRF